MDQKGWKRPTHPPTNGPFQLDKTRNRCGGELFPHMENGKSMGWNELSGEWWNCCCKCRPPTVCKTAVSKSSPLPLREHNCTAPHDRKAQHPTSPYKTYIFFPPSYRLNLSGRTFLSACISNVTRTYCVFVVLLHLLAAVGEFYLEFPAAKQSLKEFAMLQLH